MSHGAPQETSPAKQKRVPRKAPRKFKPKLQPAINIDCNAAPACETPIVPPKPSRRRVIKSTGNGSVVDGPLVTKKKVTRKKPAWVVQDSPRITHTPQSAFSPWVKPDVVHCQGGSSENGECVIHVDDKGFNIIESIPDLNEEPALSNSAEFGLGENAYYFYFPLPLQYPNWFCNVST